MDWIMKHMLNKDTTGKVKKWSSDDKAFQVKIDRQLADDYKVVCITSGKTQKELLVDWMERLVLDYKRGVIS
tara:strand:+ start:424 stop:639 length:216 start_codon:yes stop_codon:yes gene_type:complete